MIFIDTLPPLPPPLPHPPHVNQVQEVAPQTPPTQQLYDDATQYPLLLTKWRCTLYAAVLFLLLSHPRAYILSSRFHSNILNGNRTASIFGMIVHACIFLILLRILINFTE